MIEQGTPEWKAQRAGKATASRMSDIMAKGKSGAPSRTRANYEAQLICERLTGVVAEGFKSKEMDRGNEVEPEAREAYAFMKNAKVERAGFVDHPSIKMSGASPDSYVGDDGLLEIKCPNTATHLDTLLGEDIDGGYKLQIQWQLACTGRKWCDFVSYDNRLPAHLQLYVRRVERDQSVIIALESAVVTFLREVDAKIAELATFNTVQDKAA